MSYNESNRVVPVFVYVLAAAAIISLAGVLGFWLGGESSPLFDAGPEIVANVTTPQSTEPVEKPVLPEPPLYLFSYTLPGADLKAVAEEVRLAAAEEEFEGSGKVSLHRHAIIVPLPWPEHGPSLDEALEPLKVVVEADPKAEVILGVKLDPPQEWLAANPNEAATLEGKVQQQVSVASKVWRAEVCKALDAFIGHIEAQPLATHVVGYALTCLDNGQWSRKDGYDGSEANLTGFRAWLAATYADDAALAAAWGDKEAKLEGVGIPEKPAESETGSVFFELPVARRNVDFLQYTSEVTADAIAELATHVKQAAKRDVEVFVSYGHMFELTNNDSGQGALARLLDSDVDGFISPVSYHDRGVGGVGGFMGPISSAAYHGKKWFIIDDTRTGVSRDPASGEIVRLAGLRSQDVVSVQKRNFAQAVTRGIGLCWADAEGNGALCDEAIWRQLKQMKAAYSKVLAATIEPTPNSRLFPPFPVEGEAKVTLSVVVDEASLAYQKAGEKVGDALLSEMVSIALQAGVPTDFCLMSDVLEGRAAPAAVYLFLNAFRLGEDARARIHDMLRVRHAAAIWLYAPGYIDGQGASAENVSVTTRIKVKAFDEPKASGSVMALTGKWISKDQEFGTGVVWDPMFYIDDEETNVLAHYKKNDDKDAKKDSKKDTKKDGDKGVEKASVAVTFVEEEGEAGWASVFVAEPGLPACLLREILRILEQYQYFRNLPEGSRDVASFGPNVLAIHGGAAGERELDLGQMYNVQDLLDASVGWPEKQYLSFPLNPGETRLLILVPAEATGLE